MKYVAPYREGTLLFVGGRLRMGRLEISRPEPTFPRRGEA
jgi:hypothetical protein